MAAAVLGGCLLTAEAGIAQGKKTPGASSAQAASLANQPNSTKPRRTTASPTKQQCAVAYETAQEHRAAGKLTETRSQLYICSKSQCPSFVQKDCRGWLKEVTRELPSFVIRTVDADGQPATDITVELDGKQLSQAALEQAIALDPGHHQLVVKRDDTTLATRQLLAQQGIQKRKIELALGPGSLSGSVLGPDSDTETSWRPYSYASFGMGALGLGLFGVLGYMGRADEHALRDECPRDASLRALGTCEPAENNQRVSDYQALQGMADLGLIAGILGLVGGTTLFFIDSETDFNSNTASNTGAVQWNVAPQPNGAFATVQGHF